MASINSSADILDIVIETNTDFSLVLTLNDTLGAPIDLTGYTAKMQIKRPNNSNVILELSDVNGRLILGGVNGTLELKVTNNDLVTIPNIEAVYDLLLTDTTPVTQKQLMGKIIFDNGVTTI